jgi:hypothetical protein
MLVFDQMGFFSRIECCDATPVHANWVEQEETEGTEAALDAPPGPRNHGRASRIHKRTIKIVSSAAKAPANLSGRRPEMAANNEAEKQNTNMTVATTHVAEGIGIRLGPGLAARAGNIWGNKKNVDSARSSESEPLQDGKYPGHVISCFA